MGFFKSLFGSKSKPQTTTSKVELPKWLDDATQSTLGKAQTAADRPYTAYGGDRVAGFSGDQQTSQDFLRNLMPQVAGGPANEAIMAPGQSLDMPRLIDQIGGPGGGLQDYMNPYAGNVIQKTLDDIGKRGKMQRNDIRSAATMAGAFGDTGHGVLEAEQMNNELEQMGDASAAGWESAFQDAMGMRNQDLNRLLSTFGANVNAEEGAFNRQIAGQSSVLDDLLQYGGALDKSGAKQQTQEQHELDVDFAQWAEEQGWDQQQAQWLMSMVAQAPHGKTSTNTKMVEQPSLASQILGTGASMIPFFL
ncbi:MAG: hypothetical protein GY952_14215 [Rhodobacteraceae bacterium]|nr:hypothetical protein [Paracoccaceae bacterium]